MNTEKKLMKLGPKLGDRSFNLTEKEEAMIFNIAENNFAGDGHGIAGYEIWSDCLQEGPNEFEDASIPGIVASLSVKGLVQCDDRKVFKKDSCVCLTEDGASTYKMLKVEQKERAEWKRI